MKIINIVGARPQFVKAAVISRSIEEHNRNQGKELIQELIVHTGQHFDQNMSNVFFDQMNIPVPNYNLEINSLSHGAMTGKMLEKIEEVLQNEQPDWVIVYGDTNSTLAGALAAKKMQIKVAHIEAGLRSFNMRMPEEINRILTDRISDILFCPTQTAIDNLKREGFENMGIEQILCGDVMYDAVLYYQDKSKCPEGVDEKKQFILSTIHRQENTDDKAKLTSIFEALEIIAQSQKVVLPLHPRTIKKLNQFNITPNENIQIIEPVGYFEMIWLLTNASMVITDSGGLQKEAFFFKKPCLTVREETEWVELVDNGFNFLVGSDKQQIVHAFNKVRTSSMDYSINLYGLGNAGDEIVKGLIEYTNRKR